MRIIILHKSKVSNFPPIIALIQALYKWGVEVILICAKDDIFFLDSIADFCFKIHMVDIPLGKNKTGKVKSWYLTRRKFWKVINENNYKKNLMWIPTADTTLALGKELLSCNYILNLFELFDTYPIYRKGLKRFAQNAKIVICPERNRAHIFKVWWQLDKLPLILPNKPYHDLRGKNLKLPDEIEKIITEIRASKKKVAIYQGMITEDRGLIEVCNAFNNLSDFRLIIMGRETPVLSKIKEEYRNIIYIPFINPPYHLHITSHADLGILSYDYSSLNNIFCAPNKIWEYSGFGIPMLGNNIPGLFDVIEKNNIGKCADFSNVTEISNAINEVITNYEEMSNNSYKFYDSFDYDTFLKTLLKDL